MIQVLIVDDEVHCAEGVKAAIDWNRLGIRRVFTAYSMHQAMKVMEQEAIDIVISDVEMPKGSGFDMLSWFRDCAYQPVVIMLTSYASFDYAKLAIEFRCMEYLLKPVSGDALYTTMQAAVRQVLEKRKSEETSLLAEYWNKDERNRIRHFWRQILESSETMDSETIAALAGERHVTFDNHNRYLPILFKLYSEDHKAEWTEELKESTYIRVFGNKDHAVLMYNGETMLAIAGYAAELDCYYDEIFKACKAYEEHMRAELGAGLAIYFGEFLEAEKMPAQYEQILRKLRNNVAQASGVFSLDMEPVQVHYDRPDIENWLREFGGNEDAKIADTVEAYVDFMTAGKQMNRDVLTQLFHDFMQAFYVTANEKGIQAHLLFQDELSEELYANAGKSSKAFIKWIRHMLTKASAYMHHIADADRVVNEIKTYIKNHLKDELSRDQLAEAFFMSSDYISRLFRQKTGVKLMDYITDVRMNEAKNLLLTTDLPIGEVAYACGYYNVAYFSRVFRIRNGETPANYRAKK